MENIYKRLSEMQAELKAPKNLYNSFGKYSYRNAEGILEAAKPMLVKYGMVMTVSDEVVAVGERYYIKATATIHDTDSDVTISVSALAREALDKKGMDDSQITGTASSYARKYALNGLLLLDDTKDADTDENHVEQEAKAQKNEPKKTEPKNYALDKVKPEHIATLRAELKRTKVDESVLLCMCMVDKMEDINMASFEKAMKKFKATPSKD